MFSFYILTEFQVDFFWCHSLDPPVDLRLRRNWKCTKLSPKDDDEYDFLSDLDEDTADDNEVIKVVL